MKIIATVLWIAVLAVLLVPALPHLLLPLLSLPSRVKAQSNYSSSAYSDASAPTFTAACLGVTSGANKDYCNLTNGAGSGRVLRIVAITANVDSQAAVTGLQPGWTVSRYTTAGVTCTAVTPQSLDTANSALPAQVTANTNCTTDPTGLTNLFRTSTYADETNNQGSAILYQFWNRGDQPITLREGQGITLISGGSAPVGVMSITIWFTERTT